jgi:acyl carrier protein
MSLLERVLCLMSNQGCGLVPREELVAEMPLFDFGFDSLRYMELVVLIEEEFGIIIPDILLDITSSTTLVEIVDAVEKEVQVQSDFGEGD